MNQLLIILEKLLLYGLSIRVQPCHVRGNIN